MSEVKPFHGIIYNKEKIHDIARVITPPYDVISEEAQERYYERDEHNIVRIILGKKMNSDNDRENRYTRAAHYFNLWISNNILKKDDCPCLYVYEQKFPFNKKMYSRKGFFGTLKFDHKGSVKVHENTFQKSKEDRLELMKACGANTEPIFLMYKGDAVSIPDFDPLFDVRDEELISHRMWRINDEKAISEFCRDLQTKKFYIADGHHRFETAQNYAKGLRVNPNSIDPRNYIMAYFVEESDPGLLVLPTHRLLNIPNEDIDMIIKVAKKYFLIVEIDSFEKIDRAVGHVFGFCSRKDNKLYMFKLRGVVAKDKIMESKGKKNLASLDVAILHNLLLDDILEKYKGEKLQKTISYTHDEKEAIAAVKKGKHSCAFLLKPPTVGEIMKTADVDGRMPPKSTFFHPKPYSGLVMRKFD